MSHLGRAYRSDAEDEKERGSPMRNARSKCTHTQANKYLYSHLVRCTLSCKRAIYMYRCVFICVSHSKHTHTYMKLKHMYRRSHVGFKALADMGKNALKGLEWSRLGHNPGLVRLNHGKTKVGDFHTLPCSFLKAIQAKKKISLREKVWRWLRASSA